MKLNILKIILVSLICIATGLLFSWIIFVHSLSIDKAPTCITYELTNKKNNLKYYLDEKFKGLIYKVTGFDSYSTVWESKDTRIIFNISPDQEEGTLKVCTKETYASEWKNLASELEVFLKSKSQVKKIYIQLDSTICKCKSVCILNKTIPTNVKTFDLDTETSHFVCNHT